MLLAAITNNSLQVIQRVMFLTEEIGSYKSMVIRKLFTRALVNCTALDCMCCNNCRVYARAWFLLLPNATVVIYPDPV